MKQGVVFSRSGGGKEVRVARTRKLLRIVAGGLRRVGRLSWLFGLVIVIYLLGPVLKEELRYLLLRTPTGQVVEQAKNTSLVPRVVDSPEQTIDWDVPSMEYSLYIPKIGAKSRVVDNVDPWSVQEYQAALKQGVAAAKGLAHPGGKGTTYLFAHSVGSRADFARYNAIFYLLHKLDTGDEVRLVYQGKPFEYTVTERLVIPATDLSFFDPGYTDERLVLQTCYPPGTSWKRLVVVARPTTVLD